ncbi:MAG: type 4a pilus biogenesis protein PilO [Deltaproteobacteria bacterium]|nr:type 4a pilus biogenesis protein PilO [Deltaproteobacteria bacterium]
MENIKEPFQAKIEPLITKIGELTKIQRYLIYCGSILALVLIYAYVLYLPKQNKITELNKQYDKLAIELDKTKKKASQFEKLKKKMEEAKVQFQIVKKTLPEKGDIPSLLTSISQAGRDVGLEFLLFRPNKEVRKGFYAEIPVTIQVTGNYHNIALFFDRVAALSRIVNIENIKMSGGKGSSKLNLSCKAVTYRFIEGGKAKKKGKKKRKKKRKKRR